MPATIIEHEEYPSVVVIEYNSIYRNELENFIRNIKIKDNKEIVYTEPHFFKILHTNNTNIGLLTIDGRIHGYYYISKDNVLKYIYVNYPYRRNGFAKLLLTHAIKTNPNIQFEKNQNQAYTRLISSPIFEDVLKGNSSGAFDDGNNAGGIDTFEDLTGGGSKEGELTLF
ncbi:GNAT family N-acetyltransferase [Brachyspira alvinipulli]|uniref:GNAT family N-acetyltransferase n=1 Tax=Brachyspira alvinipulli TaxID=84379 RepID=UPI0026048C73|nr:GNAT family N-acetyltransferase [uncultured Brachyspira sp.]